MKLYTELHESNTVLRQFIGATAKVWMFHLSLNRLAIKLSFPGKNEVLYVVGVGCEYIQGPFSWENAEIVLTYETQENNGSNMFNIIDEKAGFKLVTSGGVILALGQEQEFGRSFDDFIKD